jgi:hypothetical protein
LEFQLMRRFTLIELMLMVSAGCFVVIAIAVGHIAGWW